MKQVTLRGTPVTTSHLGFGCAGLMRLHTEAERQRVLATAFDQGVRHFDAARMYGLGKVEGVLGDFIRTRRDEVTVTTKFGIQLNAYASRFGNIQSAVRRVLALSPALRRLARRRSQALYREQAFSVEDARQSLETSLRELKTDYVDVLLLHECSADGLRRGDDLLGFLEDARRDGKIRCFGIATTFPNTLDICREFPAYAPVAQFDSDALSRHIHLLPGVPPGGAPRAVVTHSALSGSLDAVFQSAQGDARRAARWSEAVGLDCSSRAALSSLLLASCLRANPDGVVLFHSNTAAHIAANAQAAGDGGPSEEAVSVFAGLLAADGLGARPAAA